MSFLAPSAVVHRPSLSTRLVGPGLMIGLAAILVGAGFAIGAEAGPGVIEVPASSGTQSYDPCGLPDGLHLEALEAKDRVQLVRHVLACRDRASGALTIEQYQRTLAEIDKAWNEQPVTMPVIATSEPIWASRVRGFSSQYSGDSWAAIEVLGAPDVFPGSGDNENAWASLGADDRDEWIEVAFAEARPLSAIEIYETYNPGAVQRVELLTTSGKRVEISMPRASGEAAKNTQTFACTSEPIVAARVHLASKAVEGWNEIDAIGVIPCR